MASKLGKVLQTMLRLISALLLVAICVADVLMGICWATVLWPLSFWHPTFHLSIINIIARFTATTLVAWIYTSGHKCYEVGEDVSSCYDHECLIICNHQTSFDPAILITLFHQKSCVFSNTLWILDNWIKYTTFGYFCWLREDFFIEQGKQAKDSELHRLREHLLNMNSPKRKKRQWIVLYPEGGFLRKRRPGSQRYAKVNNLPVLQHVSLPRSGAFQTIVGTLHPNSQQVPNELQTSKSVNNYNAKIVPLKWIIDVTIGYKPNKNLPTFESLSVVPIQPATVFVHYRLFPIEQVPTDADGMKSWLYSRYVEKEELLDRFHETGIFPEHQFPHSRLLDSPKPIQYNFWELASSYLFIILSIAVHYCLLKWVVSWIW